MVLHLYSYQVNLQNIDPTQIEEASYVTLINLHYITTIAVQPGTVQYLYNTPRYNTDLYITPSCVPHFFLTTVNVLKFQTFFSFFSQTKGGLSRAGIHKTPVRIANREDPDQTASLKAV